jgi:hypothetical protein
MESKGVAVGMLHPGFVKTALVVNKGYIITG